MTMTGNSERVARGGNRSARKITGYVTAPLLAAGAIAAFLIATPTRAGTPVPLPGGAYFSGADIDAQEGPESGPSCAADSRYLDKEPTGMRPDAVQGWLQVRSAAAAQGVTLCLFDGKRSTRQQQAEIDANVQRHGSAAKADRYVLPPEKSMHVKGIAADVQPRQSALWLERTKGRYGWCRRYDNEYWHFEYDANYAASGCPATSPSATG